MELDRDICYRALLTRDARFDGRFFTAVRTTGIYCRPICPARPPKLENCIFLPSAAAAQEAGFRSCLRCRPEVSPELACWRGTSNTVSRALALIVQGALDDGNVETLAARLGVGERHLRRLFRQHLGASPVSVAQTRRLLFAKRLITETALPMTDVAFASGFGSLRRFNHTIRKTYGRPPRDLRRTGRAAGAPDGSAIALTLPFSPPYDWPAMLDFLAARAIPGVESVTADRYRRTIAVDGGDGTVDVRFVGGRHHLLATIRVSGVASLLAIVGRLRHAFDLGADPVAVTAHLSTDPRLAPLVAARPGLRIPGAWDGFELAVRAILGQQITVAAATRLAGKLVAAYGRRAPASAGAGYGDGGPAFVFPRPEDLAGEDLTRIGMPRARAAAISALASMAGDKALFDPAGDLEATVERLRRLPGVGDWTAHYIAMRALHEPDAFPASDIGLLRAMATSAGRPAPADLARMAESWRPWRAYAAMHLWTADAMRARQEAAA